MSMHVIWKRPDGFHGAVPSDFTVFELEGHARLWLHKLDRDSYPFRVSGGWEDDGNTKRLNNLINMLPESCDKWVEYLSNEFRNSPKDGPIEYFDSVHEWLLSLKDFLKGDTWEMDIIDAALDCTVEKLKSCRDLFLSTIK